MPTQRLSLTATATANSAGNAIFTFPAPPTDLVWHGTLVCNAAPNGASFAVTVAGSQWAGWNGASIGGPVQALPGETVQVVGSSLTAGTVYQLRWIGRSDPMSQTVPSYPDTNAAASAISQAPGSSITVLLQGGALLASVINLAPGTAQLLPPPPAGQVYLLHNASFDLLSGGTDVMINGASTNFAYTQCVSDSGILTVPLMGQIVNEGLNVQTIGGSGGSAWLSYDLAPPPTSLGGGAVSVTFQLSHSYSVIGQLTAQTLPPFYVPVMSGQTAILEAVRCSLQSGTSIALAVQQNGANVPGLSAVSVTPTPTTSNPTNPVTLSNNDAIQAVLTSPVGSPTGLTISLYVQYT